MAFQTGLEGRPWYYGAAVGLLVAGVFYVAGHYFFFQEQRAEIASQDSRLSELQTRIQEGRAARRQLPEFREEVRRLELELERLLRILPTRRNTPDLLRRIRDLTQQGDFDLLRFTPGGFQDRDFYSEWPISITLVGGYHNLAELFDRVSRFSRIVNIQNLRIQGIQNRRRDRSINASFQAVTFVYREVEEEEVEGGGVGARP